MDGRSSPGAGGAGARLVLLTTRGEVPHHRFAFWPGDLLLAGRESEGVPDDGHRAADHRVFIPMAPDVRALNVVAALAIALGEALRQTDGLFDAEQCDATPPETAWRCRLNGDPVYSSAVGSSLERQRHPVTRLSVGSTPPVGSTSLTTALARGAGPPLNVQLTFGG